MALPHRIVMDTLEGLKILILVIPGANSDSTLLYALEIKLYARHLLVSGSFRPAYPAVTRQQMVQASLGA